MPIPDPEAGLAGREEGQKDRPSVIVDRAGAGVAG